MSGFYSLTEQGRAALRICYEWSQYPVCPFVRSGHRTNEYTTPPIINGRVAQSLVDEGMLRRCHERDGGRGLELEITPHGRWVYEDAGRPAFP